MSVEVRAEVVGAKQLIAELSKIDRRISAEFRKEARQIAAPIVSAAKTNYPSKLLSGMARSWAPKGREIFPYSQMKAVKGVKVKFSTRRSGDSVIKIVQSDPAASVFEVAGKARANPKGDRFNSQLHLWFGKPSRVVWPAAERHKTETENRMRALLEEVARQFNRSVILR